MEPQEGAPLGEQGDGVGVEAVAVLHRRAPGANHRAHHLRAVGVDRDAEALGPALVAGGLYLLVAQGPDAALADAAGGEDLHHVGSVGLQAPDVGADRLRVAGGGGHGAERGQHARPGHVSALDRVAQVGVERAPEALHGREPAHQGAVGVAHGMQRRSRGAPVPALVQPPVGAEVRRQVDVRVDPPRHEREISEVVGHRAAQAVDARDRRAVHEDAGVGPCPAGTVDQQTGAERHPRLLGESDAGGNERQRHRGGQTERAAWHHRGSLSSSWLRS